jgi:FAD/FMN-containing dehydrogenase
MARIEEFAAKELKDFRGEIIHPGDERYDQARRVWNGMIDKRPALIARCAGTADVLDTVRFARDHALTVAVRGGGHSVAGLSTCDHGMVIDLSRMNAVQVDPAARRVRVQGGAIWADVDRETQPFGLMAPGGVVSTTGVAGLTLGGGYGWTRRKYGLSCDNLLSVDLITADGRLLTASERSNPDLFWALRGGGGNFGIAVWFEFRLHELGPEVLYVSTMYPEDRAVPVFRAWRDFVSQSSDEITSDASFFMVPPFPDIPAELHGRPAVMIEAVYAGSVEAGEAAMRPLRELDTPLVDATGPMRWVDLQSILDPLVPSGSQLYYWKSVFMSEFSDESIETLAELCAERPSMKTLVPMRHLGGTVARVDAEATAFANRKAEYLLSLDSIWTDPAQTEANVAWTRRVWSAMQPYSDQSGIYINFAGLGEEGQELTKGAYQRNLDRLVEVKTRYDPTNFFRMNQNIRPKSA